jgi:hypothetical protein
LFLEKKAFTPNHQFGRQEKVSIHQAIHPSSIIHENYNIHPSIHPHEVYWLLVIPQFHSNLFEIEEILLMGV